MEYYYVVVRFIFSFRLFIFIAHTSSCIMATKMNNLPTDMTMESLITEVRNLKAELSALQAGESMHNLSLDERGR